MPLISFIVTAHDKEKFIEECLLSIKNQTYANKEIIIIDDFSSDLTFQKISQFKDKNPDIKTLIIRNERNLGQSASFIKGLEAADGVFVTMTDGDDVLFPDFAKIHINTHLQTTVALSSCRQIEIDENNVIHSLQSADCPFFKPGDFSTGTKFDISFTSGIFEDQNPKVVFLSNKKYSFATWHWSPSTSAVMRKSVCEYLLLIKNPSDLPITADKFIFSFAHLFGSSVVIDVPLYAYRRHDSNYSLADKMTGSDRHLKPDTQRNYIRNNLLIRQVMWNFVTRNKDYFIEKINKIGYRKILFKIIFSFDLYTAKSVLKSISG